MQWTDYCRFKEQIELVENSMLQLRKLRKLGRKEDVEIETLFLENNLNVLLEMKEKFPNMIFDAKIDRLEQEVRELTKNYRVSLS